MTNASLFSIPAYYFLVLFPHLYASALLSSADPKAYNNANPRASSTAETYKKALSPATLARYERAKAAHANGHESFPLFSIAILAANIAGVDKDVISIFAYSILGSRALYVLLYINTENKRSSYLRTAVWMGSTVAALALIIKAGVN